MQVTVNGETSDMPWTQFKAEDLANLAAEAFRGNGAELNAQLAAFSFAHRVPDVFYNAAMAVRASNDGGPMDQQVGLALERAEVRFAPPEAPKKPVIGTGGGFQCHRPGCYFGDDATKLTAAPLQF
jgi:hypothetical protein